MKQKARMSGMPYDITRTTAAIVLSFFYGAVTQAQVTLDGTMGSARSLKGPKYHIPAEVGQQRGGNLFHSFGLFNIDTDQSATFTGPNSVQNIIGRVTGGQSSWIDGTLSSEIPGADLYLFNPAGVMFGPNASLDVTGSFHVSTADFLRLGDRGRFDARQPSNSILTTAPPEAFGFLGPNPDAIQVNQSKLQVKAGQTLSIIGGDIQIANGTVTAPQGRVNLVSVDTTAEVHFNATDPNTLVDIQTADRFGNIAMVARSTVNVDGVGGGQVVIRGGEFRLEDSVVSAQTSGNSNGIGITVEADRISIAATHLGQPQLSLPVPRPDGTVEQVVIVNGPGIFANTFGAGKAGNIDIKTKRLELTDTGIIAAATLVDSSTGLGGTGNGGNITITAESMLVTRGETDFSAGIFANSLPGTSGDAGSINITTGSLELVNGGLIGVNSFGSGSGGDFTLRADRVLLSAEGTRRVTAIGVQASEVAASGGNLQIETGQLTMLGANVGITALTEGAAEGGDIHIIADEILLDGLGEPGARDGVINARSSCSKGDCGKAGNITLLTEKLLMRDTGISTRARQAGGGSISIHAQELVALTGSDIATSVASGSEDAGNITISEPLALILEEGSRIEANAFAGTGGNVRITTDALFKSTDSVIRADAESKLGVSGVVEVNSPNVDISGNLVILPTALIDAPAILPKPCTERSGANVIHLVSKRYEMLPDSPYALQVYLPTVPSQPNAAKQAFRAQHNTELRLPPISGCTNHG